MATTNTPPITRDDDVDNTALEKKAANEPVEHDEIVAAQREVHAQAVKPASLEHMSDEEMKKFDTKMVRKMDLIIMYVLGLETYPSTV